MEKKWLNVSHINNLDELTINLTILFSILLSIGLTIIKRMKSDPEKLGTRTAYKYTFYESMRKTKAKAQENASLRGKEARGGADGSGQNSPMIELERLTARGRTKTKAKRKQKEGTGEAGGPAAPPCARGRARGAVEAPREYRRRPRAEILMGKV